MMISYFHLLAIDSSRQSVLHDHGSHLPDLIRLCVPSLRLQVQDFCDPVLREDMVAASDALFEPQPFKKIAPLAEAYAGIGRAAENLRKKRLVLRHPANLAQPYMKAERRYRCGEPNLGSLQTFAAGASSPSTRRGTVAVAHNNLPTGERGGALMNFYTQQHRYYC